MAALFAFRLIHRVLHHSSDFACALRSEQLGTTCVLSRVALLVRGVHKAEPPVLQRDQYPTGLSTIGPTEVAAGYAAVTGHRA